MPKRKNSKAKQGKSTKITIEQWDLIVESYRSTTPPLTGAVTRASEAAGVTWRTAAKMWHKGASYLDKGPIKELLAGELIAARAAEAEVEKANAMEVAERSYREAEKARDQAIAVRRQEADMIRGFRASVIGMVGVSGSAVRGAMAQIRQIEKDLANGTDENGKKLPLKEKVEILWKLSRIMKQTGESAMDVIRAERLLLGEPTEILGFRDMDKLTEEDAIRELREAGEMAERMEKRQALRLKLVAGGKAEGKTGTE